MSEVIASSLPRATLAALVAALHLEKHTDIVTAHQNSFGTSHKVGLWLLCWTVMCGYLKPCFFGRLSSGVRLSCSAGRNLTLLYKYMQIIQITFCIC